MIKFPPQMLNHEIDHVIQHLEERLERQGMSMDLYRKSRQMEADALREEARPVAESRLKRSLILLELAEKMKIDVSPEDLQAETNRTLEGFARQMPEKDFRKFVANKENASGLIESIMMDLVLERTQEKLRNQAKGVEIAEGAQDQETGTEEESTAAADAGVASLENEIANMAEEQPTKSE